MDRLATCVSGMPVVVVDPGAIHGEPPSLAAIVDLATIVDGMAGHEAGAHGNDRETETVSLVPVSPAERDEFIAHLRRYFLELDPSNNPDEHIAQRVGRWFSEPERWLWWGVGATGDRVGLVIARRYRGWPDQRTWIGSISEFTVLPELRGRGYGRALGQAVVQALFALECERIEASVLWHRRSVASFWHKLGFNPVSMNLELARTGPTPLNASGTRVEGA